MSSRRSRRGFAVRLGAVLVAALASLEGAARAVLFWPLFEDSALATALRRPERIAHPEEDLYWWLRTHYRFGVGPEGARDHDAELGWTRWAGTDHDHPERGPLRGRRRVLLYGDSFAACQTPDSECFQGLLERSELGAACTLINYGVHAFGLDQVLLLLRRTLDHFRTEDPIVIVSLLVDRDLDRAGLSYRGGRSKPRFDVVDGRLELQPPLPAGVFPERPAAWFGPRLLVHALGVEGPVHDLVCGVDRARERNRERCRLILEAIAEELAARDLDAFFLLFHSREHLESEPGWQEPLVTVTLDRLGRPWRSTREPILGHAAATGRPLGDYFDTTGHLNGLGNLAAFRAIRAGLAGVEPRFAPLAGLGTDWGEEELLGPLSPSAFEAIRTSGARGVVRHEVGARAQFPEATERPRLVLRVGRRAPSEVTYRLAGRAVAFSATAAFARLERRAAESGGRVGVTLEADGEELLRFTLARGARPRPFEVDLTGRETFTIRIDDGGDGVAGDELGLLQPTFVRADS